MWSYMDPLWTSGKCIKQPGFAPLDYWTSTLSYIMEVDLKMFKVCNLLKRHSCIHVWYLNIYILKLYSQASAKKVVVFELVGSFQLFWQEWKIKDSSLLSTEESLFFNCYRDWVTMLNISIKKTKAVLKKVRAKFRRGNMISMRGLITVKNNTLLSHH